MSYISEMRKHIGWYSRGIRDAGKFRAEINRCSSALQTQELICSFFDNAESEYSDPEEYGKENRELVLKAISQAEWIMEEEAILNSEGRME